MTTSKVSIVNMAFSNLGARAKIESFDEQTPEGRQARLWYDVARKATLEAGDWTFARKRAALALDDTDAPLKEWTFRYVYPADCLRARYLENPYDPQGNPIPFRIETAETATDKTILTDLDEAVLVYTFDQVHPEMFSNSFVDAFAYRLASHFAMPITGKSQLKQEMHELWFITVNQAGAHDMNEERERAERDGDSIRERGYNQRYLPTYY